MNAPESYVRWIQQHRGFNPRAQQSSNALADFVVADLQGWSRTIRAALASGLIEEKKNAAIATRFVSRNVDLVLRTEVGPGKTALVTVENKTIMTAHGKARKNRLGDLIAYANHVHNHSRNCIAAGLLVVNASTTYENPDPFAKGISRARFDMPKVLASTIDLFARIPLRERSEDSYDTPEALGLILINYDGLRAPKLVSRSPAPQKDNPLFYKNFIHRIAQIYESRFGARADQKDY